MDHAINSVTRFYINSLEVLYEEWISNKYAKLSDCPTYDQCNTYRKAIKVMNDWLYDEKSETSVKEDLENHISVTRGIAVALH